jgi:hypothetical protein
MIAHVLAVLGLVLARPLTADEISQLWLSNGVAARAGMPVIQLLRIDPMGCPGFESDCQRRQWAPVFEAISAIRRDASKQADVALVQLLGFSVGTATGEEVRCEVVRRGARMLPILDYALSHPTCMQELASECTTPCLDTGTFRSKVAWCQRSITAHDLTTCE